MVFKKHLKTGQSILEYFILLSVIAGLTIVTLGAGSNFLGGVKSSQEKFVDKAYDLIVNTTAPGYIGGPIIFPYGSANFPNPFTAYTKFRIELGNGASFTVEVKEAGSGKSLGVTTVTNVNGTLQFSGTSRWSLDSVYDSGLQIFDIKWGASGISAGTYLFYFSDGTTVKGQKV